MSLKIRLSRGGAKKRPFYRIVVADSRKPRDGRFIERLGTYNPMVPRDHPERLVLKEERIKYWLGVGAKPTDRVARFFGNAGYMEMPAIPEQTKKNQPRPKTLERRQAAKEAAVKASAEEARKAAEEAEEKPAAEESAPEEPAEDVAEPEAAAEETAADAEDAPEAPAEDAAEDAADAEAAPEETAEAAPEDAEAAPEKTAKAAPGEEDKEAG